MSEIHVDITAKESCMNPMDSYGEICVRCNCCGRFDEKTQYDCIRRTYARHIIDFAEKIISEDYQTLCQQTNFAISIAHFANEIKEAVKHIDFESEGKT